MRDAPYVAPHSLDVSANKIKMTEKHYLEQLNEELSQKLGNAIWAFAKIEWLTYEYIKRLAGSSVLELVANQSFKLRLEVLEKIIKQKKYDEGLSKNAIAVFKEAKSLSEKRNTIIHNPWQVYVDLKEMEFVSEISKYMNPDHSYKAEDIELFTDEAQDIAKRMQEAIIALTSRSKRMR